MVNPQLLLGVSLRDDATFENFFSGDNSAAVSALKNCVSGDGESFIYLWGSQGVGRSHLLQACCHEMSGYASAVYLELEDYHDFSPEILDGLDQMDLVCLDNINAVLSAPDWEEALFHFYNRARDQKKKLVVSGSILPTQLPCNLEDLRSRLMWGLTFQVKSLNDSQKLMALSTRAKNRGIIFPETAGQYLLHHHSRNLSELFSILDLLEKATLVEQRRITIPFIKSVLSYAESR